MQAHKSIYILFSLLLISLLIPSYAQANSSMDVDISINKAGLVTEEFTFTLDSDGYYDSFKFFTIEKPISVSYDGEYLIVDSEGGYSIIFEKWILPGENEITFSLLYDSLVTDMYRKKVFRAAFSSQEAEEMNIRLILPENHILSENPGATPHPEDISSDGRIIILTWNFDSDAAIAVFYESTEKNIFFYSIVLILLFLSGIITYNLMAHKTKKIIDDSLTEDEKSIMDMIRKGTSRQDKIAQSLDFSKSKMSKVVRKLEEKKLLEKEPYFKTNKLKLKI